LAALGSPDPYGRQLDGMGGGISSLSKPRNIGAATHPDADVDYTFAQIEVAKATVDYKGNCGNCSSSVGPFAIDEGLVKAVEGETLVRIHNTNTRKLIIAHVPVRDGEAAVEGDFALAGVAGRGARIALYFLDPGGAGTGRLLPTGTTRESIDGIDASLVDATNPVVFVRVKGLGLVGPETRRRREPRRSTGPPVGRAADRRRGAPARRGRLGRARDGVPDGPPADGRLRARSVSATLAGARRDTMDGFYRAVRAVGRFWLWFF